jgi:putative IMPACT (imprinted ancient) family translation regulator
MFCKVKTIVTAIKRKNFRANHILSAIQNGKEHNLHHFRFLLYLASCGPLAIGA